MARVKYSDNQLREAVAGSVSWAGVTRHLLGYLNPSSQTHFRKRATLLDLDTRHFTHLPDVTSRSRRSSVLTLLPSGSRRISRGRLLRAMLDAGVEYACYTCGNRGQWNSRALLLEIDHIDGNSLNNQIHNLRFLCPNCHAQTPTNRRSSALVPAHDGASLVALGGTYGRGTLCQHCGARGVMRRVARCKSCGLAVMQGPVNRPIARRSKIMWPDPEELKSMVLATSFREAAANLGVSDQAVRNHLKRRGIDPSVLHPRRRT